ncbi:MAG: RagB/SusD family nutrient uptake outer membrane protein [Bacteroidales bacterium]
MKTTHKILLAALSVLCLWSCTTDLLPPTGIPSETFWQTEQDAWYAMNKCYANMAGFGAYMHDELTTDNAHSQKPWEGNFVQVQTSALNPGVTYGAYSFHAIRTANDFIANVDRVEMSDELKLRMKAEAQFFRAFQYLRLNQYFGKIAIITEVLDYDAPALYRNSIEEVQKFILDELQAAANVLPKEYSGAFLQEHGRITKGAALALRARAALYFGNFSEAEASAKACMDQGIYSLYYYAGALTENQQLEADEMDLYIDFDKKNIDRDRFIRGMYNYSSIWLKRGNPSPTNPEYVLTKQYTNHSSAANTENGCFMLDNCFGTANGIKGKYRFGFASFKPIQDVVDAYWDIDGQTIRPTPTAETRATNYKIIWNAALEASKTPQADFDVALYNAFAKKAELMNYDYMQEFKNRDSRLYASITLPFKGWHDSGAEQPVYYIWNPALVNTDGNYSWSGFSYRKIVTDDPYQQGAWNDAGTEDYPLIRYAEVLLTYAEARTINSGYDGEVQAALNQLRDRCGMPDVPSGLAGNAALDFIRNERRIELLAEGHRFSDIRRYGEEYASRVMSGPTKDPAGIVLVTKQWHSRNMLMPIPQTAIDRNPLLGSDQNPGY